MQAMESGVVVRREHSRPPMVTIVEPAVSQKPLPDTVILWPPLMEPVFGSIVEMAMLVVRRPIWVTRELP